MTPMLDRLRSFCVSHGMATEQIAEMEQEVRTIAAAEGCPVEYVAWHLFNSLRRSLKTMNDFIESMERIRTAQGTTKEQWDELVQGILAMADVKPRDSVTEAILAPPTATDFPTSEELAKMIDAVFPNGQISGDGQEAIEQVE